MIAIYKLNLTEAYGPAQADTPMRERTIEELEAVFNFNMTDEEAEGCCTVGDVYDVVCSHTSDWEAQGGNCASAMTFYRLRKALAPNDKRSLRPSTDLDTLGLTPSAFFDLLAARSNLRLP